MAGVQDLSRGAGRGSTCDGREFALDDAFDARKTQLDLALGGRQGLEKAFERGVFAGHICYLFNFNRSIAPYY